MEHVESHILEDDNSKKKTKKVFKRYWEATIGRKKAKKNVEVWYKNVDIIY